MARLNDNGDLNYQDPAFEAPPKPAKLPTEPVANPPLFGGGLTPGGVIDGQTIYNGADGNQYTDDPDINSATGFIRYQKKTGDPQLPSGGGGTPTSPYQPSTYGGYSSGMSKQRQSILDRLTGLMDRYSTVVDRNDPQIHAASDAYGGQMDRALAKNREMTAERAHAEGVPSGAFDAAISNAAAEGGRQTANMENQLIHDEMMSRRGALQGAIGESRGLLSDEDQNELGNRVASIDEAMRGRGLDIQESLGRGGLANASRGLDQQNNQFYDRFAYDQAHDTSQSDIAAFLHALGLA